MPNINNIFEIIDDFSKLPKGWNFGEGVPSSPVALHQSRNILNFAGNLGLKDVEAFPGIEGEIQLCFYDAEFNLEIVFEINGTLTINLERDDETIFSKKNAVLNEAIKILKDFKYKKCHSYASLTSKYITVKGKNAYQVWRSDPRQKITASQLSIGSVQSRQAETSAIISKSSILGLQGYQSSFGKSQTKRFRNPVG